MLSRLEELPLRKGIPEFSLELELPEPERFILVLPPRMCLCDVSCRELEGRFGDVLGPRTSLRASREISDSSESAFCNMLFRGLVLWLSLSSTIGEFGPGLVRPKSLYRKNGLEGHVNTGEL